ncbi:MAG TPA: hypothetical protein VG899_16755 [Mycobacteriales bacterium]|nr:hypothetical protein [Mycobacteriales bacterium]HWA68016.1 hypothetical protein [Mycobacteriales bacterium]
MTPNLHQLDEAFSTHELLAPDADAVLSRSHEIARNLKRRQWAVRATGGGVLAAGLIAGGVVIPHALQHPSHNVVLHEASEGDGSSPKDVAPTPTAASSTDDAYAAYFDAGYTYSDAQQLAQLWHESGPDAIANVKAEAGAKLLKGQTLPIPPSGTPASPQELAMDAFWNAGYDYSDAQTLAQMWHETDITQVKAEAGQKLEDGQTLPIPPSGGPVTPEDSADTDAVDAFFAAGYTYDDAVQLAQTWNTADPYHAKIEGGQKLEDGQSLPIPPSGTPSTAYVDQQARQAFFAAGYDYNDAVRLGQLWHQTDTDQIKAEAGQKLENGQTLPIQPSS